MSLRLTTERDSKRADLILAKHNHSRAAATENGSTKLTPAPLTTASISIGASWSRSEAAGGRCDVSITAVSDHSVIGSRWDVEPLDGGVALEYRSRHTVNRGGAASLSINRADRREGELWRRLVSRRVKSTSSRRKYPCRSARLRHHRSRCRSQSRRGCQRDSRLLRGDHGVSRLQRV